MRIRKSFFVVLSLLVSACAAQAQTPLTPSQQAQAKTIHVEQLVSPVQTSRLWTTALSPNPNGGFNFICEFYNYNYHHTNDPLPEWVIVDLQTGKYTITSLPGYANTNYTFENQLRAANGRIFFAAKDNAIHYYDPQTQTLHSLGSLIKPETGYTFFYRLRFGPDGMLYATTQSNNGKAALAVINPDTLEKKIYLDLGSPDRKTALTYGYNLEIDPPWVYLQIGQADWAMIALNTQTGEQRVLATRTEAQEGMMSFNASTLAVRATLNSKLEEKVDLGGKETLIKDNVIFTAKSKSEYVFCVDGKLFPANFDATAQTVPFKPMNQRPVQGALQLTQTKAWPWPTAPELDLSSLAADSQGNASLRWRPAQSQDAWQETSFKIKHVIPIGIESLTPLPDGTLIGNTKQYNGFFRYSPATKKLDYFGKHAPSSPATAVKDGLFYFCGYPNSHLFVYDPAKPWTASSATQMSTDTNQNPHVLGQFGNVAQTHYAYFLIPAPNDRIYFAGRCERRATGSGVGYYEPTTNKFTGHHDNLDNLIPRGFAVLPKVQRIVFSGEIESGVATPAGGTPDAQLVIYDMNLKELERIPVKPGLTNSGSLCPGATDSQVIGRFESDGKTMLYILDVTAKTIVKWAQIDGNGSEIVRHPSNGSAWLSVDGKLFRLNPATLALTPAGRFEKPIGSLVWVGDDLYGYHDGQLLKASGIQD